MDRECRVGWWGAHDCWQALAAGAKAGEFCTDSGCKCRVRTADLPGAEHRANAGYETHFPRFKEKQVADAGIVSKRVRRTLHGGSQRHTKKMVHVQVHSLSPIEFTGKPGLPSMARNGTPFVRAAVVFPPQHRSRTDPQSRDAASSREDWKPQSWTERLIIGKEFA